MDTVCRGVVASNSKSEQSAFNRSEALASQRSSVVLRHASQRKGSRSASEADGLSEGSGLNNLRINDAACGDNEGEMSPSTTLALPPNAALAFDCTGAGQPASRAWARHPTLQRSTAVSWDASPLTISGAT